MDKSINRILVPGQTSEAPAIPDGFREKLRRYDPSLCISWNTFRKRFVIEQCIQHNAAGPEHTHVCNRIYVCIAQDPDGCMMPLGDRVMNMIAARDVQKAGYGPNDLQRFIADNRAKRREHSERIDKQMNETIREATKDGRRQLLKAAHLIQQHNLEVNQ